MITGSGVKRCAHQLNPPYNSEVHRNPGNDRLWPVVTELEVCANVLLFARVYEALELRNNHGKTVAG